MSKPAFIVDGQTEMRIIQSICPGVPVRRTDLNGKFVKIEAIAEKIVQLIKLLNSKYYPIIILVDREDRTISSTDMTSKLRELINNRCTDEIIIGIPDIMIENWLLVSKNVAENCLKSGSCDGFNGHSELKRTNPNYHKLTDGEKLFKGVDFSKLFKSSASFREFIYQFPQEMNCYYYNVIIDQLGKEKENVDELNTEMGVMRNCQIN